MAGKKSKDKGKGFENELAKYFTETYQASFIRVPFSGAMVGGTNSKRKMVMSEGQVRSFKGDIIPPDTWTAFNCEAKFYKDFPFHQLFLGECVLLDDWISQVYDAEDESDFNIICMKFNYKGKWIAVERKHDFMIKNSLSYKDWVFSSWDNFWTKDNIEKVENLSTFTK